MARRKAEDAIVESQVFETAAAIEQAQVSEAPIAAEVPADTEKKKPAKAEVVASAAIEVRARVHFTDALTGKSFRPNDLISVWSEDRIADYERRGLVITTKTMAPSEIK